MQAGRGASAGRWLDRARTLATSDLDRAAVLGVRGMALADRGHYDASLTLLDESAALATRAGAVRQAAWSRSLAGRTHLLRRDHEAARHALDEALALVERDRWIAFQPFPEALRAEVALREGEPDVAAALVDHAFSLGCRLGDPCWEALSARARGLVHEAAGERAPALACLRDAAARAVRVADPYVWVHGYCLEALAGVAIADAAPEAAEHVAAIERVAAHADMRELVVRAALHRARLGDASAVAPARLLAEAIDNPALHAELAAAA